jgi:type I restriction enzyme S subunit
MMSRIDDLIMEICQDGVEYISIGSAVNYEQPSKYIVKSTDYSDLFSIPVLTAGQSFILGYTNEKDNIYQASKENPVVIFDDFTGAFKWVDFQIKVKSSAMKMLTANADKTTLRYIYHIMGNIGYSSDEHKRLWISIYSAIKIPLPPLPVQQEIVRILDNFTELKAELKAELTAELTARKKQYEYYRDELLYKKSAVPMVSLKTVVKRSSSGSTPTKGVNAYYENGTVPWLRSQDVKFNEIYEIKSFITEEAVKKTSAKWIPENCVIVAISGATAGRCAINKIATTTNQHCLNMEIDSSKVLYKYVYYCVYSRYEELISRKQGARGDLNSTLIMGIEIPLPPIKEQERIVKILDQFDALCNDLNIGLPAEIEARCKQYEYYRDKLLSFKEASA